MKFKNIKVGMKLQRKGEGTVHEVVRQYLTGTFEVSPDYRDLEGDLRSFIYPDDSADSSDDGAKHFRKYKEPDQPEVKKELRYIDYPNAKVGDKVRVSMTERGCNWNIQGRMDKYINCEEVFTVSSVDLNSAQLQGHGDERVHNHEWYFKRDELVLVEAAK